MHLQRLARSAAALAYQLDVAPIEASLAAITSAEALKVRLLVDRLGQFNIDTSQPPDAMNEVRLGLAAQPVASANPRLLHKTTDRSIYDAALASMVNVGDEDEVDDVVLFNEHGEVTECSIYNIFLVFGADIVTPPASSGLLPGVQRQALLAKGWAVERVVMLEELDAADRIFVSNALRGVLPARLVAPQTDENG
jgi:branched-subunit amino acid aminotransferase/4-amino-4-deoxychorismate lyase